MGPTPRRTSRPSAAAPACSSTSAGPASMSGTWCPPVRTSGEGGGSHKDGRTERGCVAPPALPLVVLPGPGLRTELAASHDPGERLLRKSRLGGRRGRSYRRSRCGWASSPSPRPTTPTGRVSVAEGTFEALSFARAVPVDGDHESCTRSSCSVPGFTTHHPGRRRGRPRRLRWCGCRGRRGRGCELAHVLHGAGVGGAAVWRRRLRPWHRPRSGPRRSGRTAPGRFDERRGSRGRGR